MGELFFQHSNIVIDTRRKIAILEMVVDKPGNCQSPARLSRPYRIRGGVPLILAIAPDYFLLNFTSSILSIDFTFL